MPELEYENSAGRLLSILNGLKQSQPANIQLIPIFALGPIRKGRKGTAQGIKAITELQLLYIKFLSDLDDTQIGSDEKRVLLKGLSSLESLVYIPAFNSPLRLASEAEKAILEVCATKLSHENRPTEDELKNITKSISNLNKIILDSNVSTILKNILLELIRLSDDSIKRYHIYGAKGLKKAFKGMLAEVAEIYMLEETEAHKITKSKEWKAAFEHIKLFDSVASRVNEYKPLIESATQFLLGN
ncbi:MAG: hypothetical protein GY941_08740 [Planctomycetes bacterium]|nr:hypothetical protein [Planctomycetota bacterium]